MSVTINKKGRIVIKLDERVDIDTYNRYIDALLELVKTQQPDLSSEDERFYALDFIQKIRPAPCFFK